MRGHLPRQHSSYLDLIAPGTWGIFGIALVTALLWPMPPWPITTTFALASIGVVAAATRQLSGLLQRAWQLGSVSIALSALGLPLSDLTTQSPFLVGLLACAAGLIGFSFALRTPGEPAASWPRIAFAGLALAGGAFVLFGRALPSAAVALQGPLAIAAAFMVYVVAAVLRWGLSTATGMLALSITAFAGAAVTPSLILVHWTALAVAAVASRHAAYTDDPASAPRDSARGLVLWNLLPVAVVVSGLAALPPAPLTIGLLGVLSTQIALLGRDLHQLRTAQRHLRATLQETTRQLEASEHARLADAATLSHDTRNEIATIRAAVSQALAETARTSPQAREQHERALAALLSTHQERVGTLLDGLLLRHNRLAPMVERIDLHATLTQVVNELTEPALGKGVTLLWGGDETPLWIQGDRLRIARVLRTVIEHAVTACQQGGEVAIATRAGEQVRCIIVDTGPGLPALELASMQEQINAAAENSRGYSVQARKSGTLDLPLCARILRLMQGSLTLTAEPEMGLRVDLDFTAADPMEIAQPGSVMPRAILAGQAALIVEDDTSFAEKVTTILRALGSSSVDQCADVASAKALLRQRPYRIAIIDEYLEGLDRGSDLARWMADQRETRQVLRISCSSSDRSTIASTPVTAGQVLFHEYLSKPIDNGTAIGALSQALRSHIAASPQRTGGDRQGQPWVHTLATGSGAAEPESPVA